MHGPSGGCGDRDTGVADMRQTAYSATIAGDRLRAIGHGGGALHSARLVPAPAVAMTLALTCAAGIAVYR